VRTVRLRQVNADLLHLPQGVLPGRTHLRGSTRSAGAWVDSDDARPKPIQVAAYAGIPAANAAVRVTKETLREME